MRVKNLAKAALCLTLALGLAAPALAGDWMVEGMFGYYDPDSIDDNGEIYGARVGYRANDHFGMLLSGGVIDLEDDFLDIENADLQFGLFLTDFSFQWFPTGKSFYLFAGPGYASIDLEIDVPGSDNDIEESDDIFTVNGGVGYQWMIGDGFYIRPEFKARWFDGQEFQADEADSWDGLDTEYSIGIGWKF